MTEEESTWRWELSQRITTLEELKKFVNLTESEEEAVSRAEGRFPMAITPYFMKLIDPNNPRCPIRKEVIPTIEEFLISNVDQIDPLAEDRDSPVPNLVHRYPDRVLLLVTDLCACYCRYCTRRRLVGQKEEDYSMTSFLPAFQYIATRKEIRDVLVSGGDPLLLPNEKLEWILDNLRAIPTVEIIRIGTRVPVTLPSRITDELVKMLKGFHPLWMNIHFSHPKEITPQVAEACDKLSLAGIPLGSQTVLLRGINDSVQVMKELMHKLLKIRVRPYYIYQCDFAEGISHFRTSVSKGVEIISNLQGFTSGMAVPNYVIDAPGGGGKIPVPLSTVVSYQRGNLLLKNYKGEIYPYKTSFTKDRKIAFREALSKMG